MELAHLFQLVIDICFFGLLLLFYVRLLRIERYLASMEQKKRRKALRARRERQYELRGELVQLSSLD